MPCEDDEDDADVLPYEKDTRTPEGVVEATVPVHYEAALAS